jgi:hypothetical protein
VETLGTVIRDPLPLVRVVVLERSAVPRLVVEELSLDKLVAAASGILHEQRRALEHVEDPRWREHLDHVLAEEARLLREAFAQAMAVARLIVPTHLPAGESVAAIAADLAVGV